MQKVLIILILIIVANISCIDQQESKHDDFVKNIEIFGRLYGYVKYFYPGSARYKVDWDDIGLYGVQKVKNATSNQELLNILKEIFNPVAPAIVIYDKKNDPCFHIKELIPKDNKYDKFIFWEHQGLGLGMATKFFSSQLIEIDCNKKADTIYPEFGEYIKAELGNGLMAYIPLVLYSHQSETYPLTNKKLYNALLDSIQQNYPQCLTGDSINIRLADVIVYWNVFKHFYPHFYEKQRLTWDRSFHKFLKDAWIAKNRYDFLYVMQKHIALLNDGHAVVRLKNDTTIKNFAPVTFAWIESSLIVSDVCDTTLIRLRVGDIVLKINSMESLTYLDSIEQYISASTFHYKRYISSSKIKLGSENSKLLLKIKRNDYVFNYTLKRDYPLNEYNIYCSGNIEAFKEIKPNIYYIHLGIISQEQFDTLIPVLSDAENIIFDVSYPRVSFLSYLLNAPDTCTTWWQVPVIYHQDYSNTHLIKRGWEIKPENPHFNGKIIFISRAKCKSYAESVLSYVKSYKLGTIIGEPSAGTNGNINFFRLFGDYSITWTNAICLMQNGESYYGKGIEPDIHVNKTISGIRQGKDELLEKAIEIAQQNNE